MMSGKRRIIRLNDNLFLAAAQRKDNFGFWIHLKTYIIRSCKILNPAYAGLQYLE